MNLYLLRHGIAADPGAAGCENDSERPLIPKGERRLRAAAAAMKKLGLSFDLILSSPFLRARQTAEIVAGELRLKKRLEIFDELVPGGNSRALMQALSELKPAPENVLLVGHEPDAAAVEMKKGGLCKLEAAELRNGQCARLIWLLTPAQMELMA